MCIKLVIYRELYVRIFNTCMREWRYYLYPGNWISVFRDICCVFPRIVPSHQSFDLFKKVPLHLHFLYNCIGIYIYRHTYYEAKPCQTIPCLSPPLLISAAYGDVLLLVSEPLYFQVVLLYNLCNNDHYLVFMVGQ